MYIIEERRKMRIGILAAAVQEIQGLLDSIAIIYKYEQPYLVYAAIIQDKEVIIAISGIGRQKAGNCAKFLISKFQVEYIINIGFAGAAWGDIGIGNIVMARKSILQNSDMFFEGTFLFGEIEDAKMVDIITVDSFYCSKEAEDRRYAYVAMEGYGVAAECKKKAVYFDEIRCISDYGCMDQLMDNSEGCSKILGENVMGYLCRNQSIPHVSH